MKLFIGRYFMKTVIVTVISVVTTAMLIAFMGYDFAASAFDSNHIEDQVKITELLTAQLDAELETVVKSTSSIIMDHEILQTIYTKDMEQETGKLSRIQQALITYSKNVKNIYSADLYLPASNLLISSTHGIVTSSAISDETVRLYQTVEALRKSIWMHTKQQSNEDVISFFQPLPVQSNFPQAYLAVHIRERSINNIIKSLTDNSHEAFVVSESGKIISSENKAALGRFLDLDKQRMLKDLLDSPTHTGYIKERVTNTFTAFSRSSSTDWVTVLRFPNESFFSYKETMLTYTAWLVLIVAGAALLWVPPVYLYMYMPAIRLIRGMGYTFKPDELHGKRQFPDEWKLLEEGQRHTESELVRLQERNGKQSLFVKELALFRLLHGSSVQSAPEHVAAFIQEQSLDERHKYWTMVIEPEPDLSDSNFHLEEPSLQFFAISTLCEKIIRENHLGGDLLLSLDMKHIIILCSVPLHMKERQWNGTTSFVAETIQNEVNNNLKLSVSIGIGNAYSLREGIHHSYREACECLQERLVLGLGRIIKVGDMSSKSIYSFPYDLESLLIRELKQNNQEECFRYIDEIFLQLLAAHANSHTVIQTAYTLYLSIIRVVGDASDGQSLSIQWDIVSPPCWITMDELVHWFKYGFMSEVFNVLALMNENKGRQTVEAIKEYLYETVTEIHSLTSIAEQFGLNPSYLSRLFKKLNGQSFVQFTANLKIEKAKQLLLDTNLSMIEVAEAVGYTERTFGRVFKNVMGTTPANYRVQQKKK